MASRRGLFSLGLLVAALAFLASATSALALPAGWGYEKVSPGAAAKNDADIPYQLGSVRSSADGSKVTWLEAAASPSDEGSPLAGQALASLGADGWTARGIAPPLGADEGGSLAGDNVIGYQDFSQDLSKGVLSQAGPAMVAGAPEEQGMRHLYLRDLAGGGGYQLLTPRVGPLTLKDTLLGYGTILYTPFVADATPNFSHIVYEDNFLPHVPGAPEGPGGLEGTGIPSVYDWSDGQLRLASVLPNDLPAPQGGVAGAGMQAGVMPGAFYPMSGDRVISDDGSHIFFTVPKESLGEGFVVGDVYVRIDGSETKYVSESHRTPPDPEGPLPAQFVTASTDGRYAFIASYEKLTDNSTARLAGPENGAKRDLYRYDSKTESLVDLTASLSLDDSYEGLIGSSKDGNTIYFGAGGHARVWSNGVLGDIGDIYGGDYALQNYYAFLSNARKRSAVSADGRWAVITTENELTGQPTGGFMQLFLFDRDNGTTKCISCPESGAPTGQASTTNITLYTDFPVFRYYLPRSFNDAGTLFTFSTPTRLTSEDRNTKVDVYQYETETGRVRLISQGTGNNDAYPTDASADGKTVFFATRERLLPEDDDGLVDLYVARPGGHSRGDEAAPPCKGEACQGEPSDPPDANTPPSAAIAGPGNAKPRRHGRCAKPAKAKRAKASSKGCKAQRKKRAAKQKHAKRTASTDRRVSR